jgi:dTDP-4-dehydrorhamnose reductase
MEERLALWGGVECTVNRVGDRVFSQLERNGHATRETDLKRFASLGIQALRYPVLWERTAPAGIEQAQWSWLDARLSELRDLGVQPIAGLLHHGSGPLPGGLLDPDFATGLAGYAGAVAQRYPWLEFYTPVNEPNTTARFSGLYGVWHPHGRDDRTYLQALINQCKATVYAMREV